MKYIVYLSTAVKLMDNSELVEILTTARKNNTRRQVTGVLLYGEGSFIQVLEGQPEDVDSLFNEIKVDPRHKGILKMIDRPLEERNFADWSMGFKEIPAGKAKELEGFIKSKEDILNADRSHTAITALKTFITTNQIY